MRLIRLLMAAAGAAAGLACAPDIETDPLPAVMEFDPAAKPARVSEPSFAAVDRATGKIDLSVAGINVPPDCADTQLVPPLARAQCEFNQYLESLDGFPTAATARTPASAPLDPATLTVPQNVAVVDGVARQLVPAADVGAIFDPTSRYLVVAPRKPWPVGSFVWIGVRGYDSGVKAQGGQPVAGSIVYNLLKRDEPLTCGATSAATIPATCPYLGLLAQQMSDEAARRSLWEQLEPLRLAFVMLGGWSLMETVGGIPKAQAAVLWGFPIHSNPVIDLNPLAGLVPQPSGADEIRLAVNGTLDPATVKALRVAQSPGTVLLLDLDALATPMGTGGFPPASASYADGAIVIKTDAPLTAGKQYGILISKGVKDLQGRSLVPPPLSVLLMARGTLLDGTKSTVSSIGDIEAAALEPGRRGLATLLDDVTFQSLTGMKREDLGYLFAFRWVTP